MQKIYDGMLADVRSFGDTVTSDQLRAAGKKKCQEIHELEAEECHLKIKQDTELKQRQVEIRAKLEEESHELKEAVLDRKLALTKQEIKANREAMKGENAAIIQFLMALNNVGVDMMAFIYTAGGMKVASSVLS
eukprot:15347659-Ditylum_brightwellii.AAC.1